MSCPAPVEREATGPDGTDVHFDSPSPTGGRPPSVVRCEPESGSVFPIGDTTARCTATDAAAATVMCELLITVRGLPRTLSRTRFTAFGDSITDGATSLAPVIMLNAVETYPFKLEQMLLQGYPTQTFVVSNQGRGGEDTREGADRLPSVLNTEKPQVVLLLEGINNVNGLSVDRQAAALREMITDSQRLGVEVIIATVMPVTPAFSQYRSTTLPKIQALNRRILELANEYRLSNVVDLYSLFEANIHLIGIDGVHPTAEGQTRIAEAFRDEIVRRYEARATMTSGFLTVRGTHGR